MSSNITTIHGAEVVTGGVDQSCIDRLEDLLERAKSGDVVGVQVVVNYGDESVGWAFAGTHWGTRSIGAAYSMLQDLDRNINGE